MTRSYSFRNVARRVARVVKPARDASIAMLSFTCYRLVAIEDPAPDEAPFEPVELCFPPNMMAALATGR